MGSISPQSAPVRIFIAGGSYAGLSTAMNLLDMASGANPRMAGEDFAHVPNFERMDIEITIADERDGFCKYSHEHATLLSSWAVV